MKKDIFIPSTSTVAAQQTLSEDSWPRGHRICAWISDGDAGCKRAWGQGSG